MNREKTRRHSSFLILCAFLKSFVASIKYYVNRLKVQVVWRIEKSSLVRTIPMKRTNERMKLSHTHNPYIYLCA